MKQKTILQGRILTLLLFMVLLIASCKAPTVGKATSTEFEDFSLTGAGRSFDVDEIVLVPNNAGSNIDGVQTCAPPDVNPGNTPPVLLVANDPLDTKSRVLIMEDLGSVDVPFNYPLVHWVVWDIPVTEDNLDVFAGVTGNNEVTPLPSGVPSVDYDNVYTGPCPDTTGRGDLENHKYIFTAYALPVYSLGLDAESSASDVRNQMIEVTSAGSLEEIPHVVLTSWYPENPNAQTQSQNQVPVAVLTADKTTVTVDEWVTLDASDSDGNIVELRIDWENDGGYEDVVNSDSLTSTRVYSSPGTYIAVLKVTDNEGATDTAEVEITVIPAEGAVVPEVPSSCGNGIIEGTEQCDDGNQDDSDLCLFTCAYRTLDSASFVWELVDQLDSQSDVQANKERAKDLFKMFLRGLQLPGDS